jgi:hypothetical protein
VDWYVHMIFATDEDEDEDADPEEGEGEGGRSADENEAGAKGSSSKASRSASVTGSWAGVKWAVKPTGAWKCDKCYVPNPWEQAKCLAGKSAATHAAGLAAALAPAAGHGVLPGDARRGASGACAVWKQLDESALVDWSVRMIFATDEDLNEDTDPEEGEGEGEGEGGLSADEDEDEDGTEGSSKA